jgi:Holliday junction resolvase RusA-like endonuclease
MLRIVILGKPETKSNFRFSRNNPKSWKDYEKWSNYEDQIARKGKAILNKNGFQTYIEPCLAVVFFYFPDKRKRDIHNYTKSLFDALEKARVVKDDSLFKPVVLMGAETDKEKPRVEVEVYPLSELKEYEIKVIPTDEAKKGKIDMVVNVT